MAGSSSAAHVDVLKDGIPGFTPPLKNGEHRQEFKRVPVKATQRFQQGTFRGKLLLDVLHNPYCLWYVHFCLDSTVATSSDQQRQAATLFETYVWTDVDNNLRCRTTDAVVHIRKKPLFEHPPSKPPLPTDAGPAPAGGHAPIPPVTPGDARRDGHEGLMQIRDAFELLASSNQMLEFCFNVQEGDIKLSDAAMAIYNVIMSRVP